MDKLLTEKDIRFKSLKRWANTFGVSYKSVPSLNHPKALSFIGDLHPDGVLYGGGGILKKAFLDAAQHKVLNPHSGPLPHVRGMNACEWSLLLGFQPTVTIHFIDVGIDTGAVVDALPVAVDPGDDIALLRSKCTVIGIEGLIKNLHYLNLPLVQNRSDACLLTRQCYVLSPVLSELLERRLEQGVYVNRGSTR
jgi:methionyl-tRNA formyltransferase